MLSWISELDRLEKLSQNAMREPANYLPLSLLYINKQNVVDSAVHKYIELESNSVSQQNGRVILTKERLLKLASQYAKTTSDETKYICKELMLFHIPIEPEQVEHFSQMPTDHTYTEYTKTFVMIEDIAIDPSMFIFHSLNRLYMIFMECPDRSLPKSCLKSNSNSNSKSKSKGMNHENSKTTSIGKMTKRVRFKHTSSSSSVVSQKGKKTRKAI